MPDRFNEKRGKVTKAMSQVEIDAQRIREKTARLRELAWPRRLPMAVPPPVRPPAARLPPKRNRRANRARKAHPCRIGWTASTIRAARLD